MNFNNQIAVITKAVNPFQKNIISDIIQNREKEYSMYESVSITSYTTEGPPTSPRLNRHNML
jgi:hypothetical protein